MIRSGAAEQPEPAQPSFRIFRIVDPLLCAFRTVALSFALSPGASRLRKWWKHIAAELTLDLRPRKTKQIRKSKAKGNSARHPGPGRLI
jgi:hypothetical protein